MRIFYSIILLLFISFSGFAQITVAAELDSTHFLVGDQFKLHISANHASNVSVKQLDLSVFKENKHIELLNETDWDTMRQSKGFILKKDLLLTVFDSGSYWIPALPFQYERNGVLENVATNSIPISVNTVQLADSIQLAPIKDIIREPATWRDYIPHLLILAALGLMVGLYFWMKKRKKPVVVTAPPPPPVPAYELALKALHQLKSEQLWQRGQVKTYQSRLTDIIRTYLESRYEIPALESTTDEILTSLQKVDFDTSWKEKLQNILQIADLVKFAKAQPDVDFHDKVWQEAVDFVQATAKK